MVRAKFRCTGVVASQGMDGYTVHLSPVISGSEENKKFYEYTPGGCIILSTINEEAAKQFTAGQEFYVDFTKADE